MKKTKILIDVLLLIVTILLTSIDKTGQLAHEILGIWVAILLIIHIFLNWNWVKQITKNFKKVNKKTKIMYIVNIFTMIIYLGSIVFGIIISNELFRFKTSSNIYLVITHILLGRLTIIVMFIHIGMHLDRMFIKVKSKKLKRFLYCIYIIIAILVSIYSIYTLTNSYQWMYMFGTQKW